MSTLLAEIERYLRVFSVSPRQFSIRAGCGKDLVMEMRTGRVPRRTVCLKIQNFIDSETARFRKEYA